MEQLEGAEVLLSAARSSPRFFPLNVVAVGRQSQELVHRSLL